MIKKAAVLGNPISHSKSPRLHNHWLQILGIDGRYEKIKPEIDDFNPCITLLMEMGYQGCNVTIPFKEEAASISSSKSAMVENMSAANTLVFNENIAAHNTDGYGFGANIKNQIPNWNIKGSHVVLGAGGSAKAIVSWLISQGAKKVDIVNRNLSRAEDIAGSYKNAQAHGWGDLPHLMKEAVTLINCTSLGMNGQNNIEIDFSNANSNLIVNDIVYTPLETHFLKTAKEANLRTVDGLGMLLWQARPGFRSWFGQEAPAIDAGLRSMMLSQKIVGLTGSIGMGKSTVASMFKNHGFIIWEADNEVAKLYNDDEELRAFILKHCPQAMDDGFEKSIWREFVISNVDVFAKLETLIHTKIAKTRREFLECDAPLKLCDIPLLFENNLDAFYDVNLTVSCREDQQFERVMARSKMNKEQFEAIVAKQMPDHQKREKADIVVDTSVSHEDTQKQVKEIIQSWKL